MFKDWKWLIDYGFICGTAGADEFADTENTRRIGAILFLDGNMLCSAGISISVSDLKI